MRDIYSYYLMFCEITPYSYYLKHSCQFVWICDRVWENRSYRHNNWYPFFACTWKLHSCTTQKHQALIGLHGVPGCSSRQSCPPLWILPVCVPYWGHMQHCCLSPNGCFSPPSASHPPPPPPPPPSHPYIESIRDITGTEKNYPKNQQNSSSL